MQGTFDFGAAAILAAARDQLQDHFGPLDPPPRRTPMAQLVKSLISNRTYDRISLEAFEGLEAAYAGWTPMAAAPAVELQARIATVEHADRKAVHLAATLRLVDRERPDFDLGFLGDWPADAAFGWLERLPGVGRKVAASTLNFSTLQRPALVIDTHVERILRRLGVVGRRADTVRMYETAMSALTGWPSATLTDLHVWMKRLGQTLCRPTRPACADCPLRMTCTAETTPAY